MHLGPRSLAALILAFLLPSCGAASTAPARAAATDGIAAVPDAVEPAPVDEPAPDMTVYWANVGLVSERYCQPIATLSSRVLDACGCSAEERELDFLSQDELAASCSYHLIEQIPEDRPMTVNEPALAACMALLDASLTGCTEARLPVECELARLFDPAPGVLAYSRPAGSECRAENGDESFDAHFLCADGLTCAGTCTREPSADTSDRVGACRRPLWLPPAIP